MAKKLLFSLITKLFDLFRRNQNYSVMEKFIRQILYYDSDLLFVTNVMDFEIVKP